MSELLDLANAARMACLDATSDGTVVQLRLGISTQVEKRARKQRRSASPITTAPPVLAETGHVAKTSSEGPPSRLALALRQPIQPYRPLQNPRCYLASREVIPSGGRTERFVVRKANGDRTEHAYQAFIVDGSKVQPWTGLDAIQFIKATCPETAQGVIAGHTITATFDAQEIRP